MSGDDARIESMRRAIEANLDAGERVLWLGPRRVRAIDSGGAGAAVIGAILLLACVPAAARAFFGLDRLGPTTIEGPTGLGGKVLCVGLALAGVGLLLAPLWRRRSARRTAYVVTDRRVAAFTVRGDGSAKRVEFDLDLADYRRRDERADGSGDLLFDVPRGGGGGALGSTERDGIRDVAGVIDADRAVAAARYDAQRCSTPR